MSDDRSVVPHGPEGATPTGDPCPAPADSIATMTTIDDTAVVFEGGGMRNAYTAAVVSELIAEGINFPHVSGVSAGASHLCNFVSRDAARSHATFVDLVDDPEFGGVGHFRRGQGYFNAEYIYERICYPDGAMPFNLGAFLRNPARTNVAAFNASRGEVRWFTKDEISTLDTLGPVIRASSTLPILMPPTIIEGDTYVDGALGPNGGLPFDAPLRDGYRKLLVVLTRPRDYVKPPLTPSVSALLRMAYRRFPSVHQGVALRASRYNTGRRCLFGLEERGRAYVFCPDNLWITNTESHRERLEATYRAGLVQIRREMPAIKAFLGM